MHLIFGGAYQGKLDYAKERYQLNEQDIFYCAAGKALIGQDLQLPLPDRVSTSRKKPFAGLRNLSLTASAAGSRPRIIWRQIGKSGEIRFLYALISRRA
jgi:hypothetical protein